MPEQRRSAREIAQRMGRSAEAIRVKARWQGWPCREKRSGALLHIRAAPAKGGGEDNEFADRTFPRAAEFWIG